MSSKCAEATTERAHTVDARSVTVSGVRAELAFRVSAQPSVSMRIRGPKADVDALELVLEPPVVTLRRAMPTTGSGAPPDDPAPRTLEITVELPVGADVVLRNVTGDATIGDTQGALVLDLEDDARVTAGCVRDARIRIAGDARADVAQVTGRLLEIDVVGSGRVLLRGDVERLRARVAGSGNVCFVGAADEADLVVKGPGHVSVQRVRHSLARSCLGSGNAIVTIPPALDADRSSAAFRDVEVLPVPH